MDEDSNAELEHLTIRTPGDLRRLWRLVMRPLGFRTTSLWLTLVGPDGRPLRVLVEITGCEVLPDVSEVTSLFDVLDEACRCEELAGASVAFLITRPGHDGVSAFDRHLATRLIAGAREARIDCHPVHVANNLGVHAVTPNDLAA